MSLLWRTVGTGLLRCLWPGALTSAWSLASLSLCGTQYFVPFPQNSFSLGFCDADLTVSLMTVSVFFATSFTVESYTKHAWISMLPRFLSHISFISTFVLRVYLLWWCPMSSIYKCVLNQCLIHAFCSSPKTVLQSQYFKIKYWSFSPWSLFHSRYTSDFIRSSF